VPQLGRGLALPILSRADHNVWRFPGLVSYGPAGRTENLPGLSPRIPVMTTSATPNLKGAAVGGPTERRIAHERGAGDGPGRAGVDGAAIAFTSPRRGADRLGPAHCCYRGSCSRQERLGRKPVQPE
jgi:hypothetical protein